MCQMSWTQICSSPSTRSGAVQPGLTLHRISLPAAPVTEGSHAYYTHAMQVVNKGLRYMLKGETNRLYEYRDELSKFGQYFSDRNNIAGATFVYTVYNLEGIYLTAFEKMFAMLEDSGWQLQKEPKEGEELELMEEPTAEELGALGYTAQ